MKKFRVWVCFTLILVTLLNPLIVYADPEDASEGGGDALAEISELDLGAITGMTGDKLTEQFKHFSLIVQTFRASGCSDEMIAGVLANIKHESNFDPYATEGDYGYFEIALDDPSRVLDANSHPKKYQGSKESKPGGVGLCQWTYSRHAEFESACITYANGQNNLLKEVVHNWYDKSGGNLYTSTKIADAGFQVSYILNEGVGLTENQEAFVEATVTRDEYKEYVAGLLGLGKDCSKRDSNGNEMHPTSESDYKDLSITINSYSFPSYKDVKELGALTSTDSITANLTVSYRQAYKSADGVYIMSNEYTTEDITVNLASGCEVSAIMWCISWEKPQNMHKVAVDRAKTAILFYELITGSDFSRFVDTTQAEIVATQLSNSGFWGEEELEAYAKLTEADLSGLIANATRENLDAEQLEGLVGWEENIKYDEEENGLIAMARKIVMMIGILFTVWVIFIYIAYWFDRLNNFVYLDALGVLTFGKLHISDTESECTFSIHNMGKGEKKTVNHKAILFICLTGIAFGVLVISGAFYVILGKFVRFINGIFS